MPKDRDAKLSFPLTTSKEGEVTLKVPKLEEGRLPSTAPVFYNPRMELNRDAAVLFLQCFQAELDRKISVCEPLSGCGVRGLRFAVEVEGTSKIVINDINPEAAALASLNVKSLDVSSKVEVYNLDANLLMAKFSGVGERFDYVDIDPFGSPSPYIHSALKAVKKGGVFALTATDMAPLCGVHPKACLRHYGAKPLRTEYCHELAVRILTGYAAVSAAQVDLAVEPIFCHSTDHYIRVYLEISKSALKADYALSRRGYIYHCFKCFNRKAVYGFFPEQIRCENCGSPMDFAGPLWLGNLWRKKMVETMVNLIEKKTLGQKKRLGKILRTILEEISSGPTYFVINRICDELNISTPPLAEIIKRLSGLGYRVGQTHFNPLGIKSNISTQSLRDVLVGLASDV